MHSNHSDPHEVQKEFKFLIIITLAVLILEIIGGLISNSLALLSDAAHVFTDLFALSIGFIALKLAARKATTAKTFGYHRAEILSALINGIALILISLWIFYEAYQRIVSPPEVKTFEMLVVAFIGLAVNLWIIYKLHGYSDLNIRGIFLHALGDTLSSIAVIIGGVWITLSQQYIADPVMSIIIAVILLINSFRLVRESIHILLEGTPGDIKIDEVINAMKVSGVKEVHDVHIWSICSSMRSLSAHIFTEDIKLAETENITKEINKILKENFNIEHTTLQFECTECEDWEMKH